MAEPKNFEYILIGKLMQTDTVIRNTGMKALKDSLGIIEAERFITIILREPFDYTKWHGTLFDSLSVEEISHAAMQGYVVDDKKTLA